MRSLPVVLRSISTRDAVRGLPPPNTHHLTNHWHSIHAYGCCICFIPPAIPFSLPLKALSGLKSCVHIKNWRLRVSVASRCSFTTTETVSRGYSCRCVIRAEPCDHEQSALLDCSSSRCSSCGGIHSCPDITYSSRKRRK